MLIKAKVFPNSKKSTIMQKLDGSFEVKVKSAAKQGEANKEALRLLADFFNIFPSQIKLTRGAKKRNKIFEIPDNLKFDQIDKAVEILSKGGIIAYPTDTVYGIGCNIFDEKAVKRIFKLKGRDFKKPLSIAVSGLKMLEKIVFLTEKDKKFLQKILPGPVTVILPKKPIVPDLVTGGSKFAGIRIPDHKIVLEMIEKAGFPVITTSANVSGKKAPTSLEKFDLRVDFVLKGKCRHKKPSTVIDLKNKAIIRRGSKIKDYLSIINNY